jgi:hypothetical protein
MTKSFDPSEKIVFFVRSQEGEGTGENPEKKRKEQELDSVGDHDFCPLRV